MSSDSKIGSHVTISDGGVLGARVTIEIGARLVAPRLLATGASGDLKVRDDVIIGAGAIVIPGRSDGSWSSGGCSPVVV
jgi:acetyltransferase-like isoleucine patch superfamily enzyme